MKLDQTVQSFPSRVGLFVAAASIALGLGAATPAAAAVCTVGGPPTGGPNNFATIQAAVAANQCTVINVKPGTYHGPVAIARNLTLRGASAQTTTIDLDGNLANPLTAIVEIKAPATKVTVERFTIMGPGAGTCGSLLFGVFVRDGAQATIQNNHLAAIRDQGISGCQNGRAIVVGWNAFATSGHAVIKNNTIDDYQKTGIQVDGPTSTAVISRNDITGDADGLRIAAQNGITISRGATADVSGNTVVDNRFDDPVPTSAGILLFEAGDDVTVSGNTADGNDVGVWVVGTSNATVSRNKVRDSIFDGIAIDHTGTAKPTGFNSVQQNTLTMNGSGVGLYGADSNTIDLNTASKSDGPGFSVDASSNGNFFTRNRASKNGEVGIEDASAGAGTAGTANSYSGNTCTGNTGGKSSPAGLC